MRTTLDIDEDVLLAAKERARHEGRSVGSVVSSLARDALTTRRLDESSKHLYGFHPLQRRGGVVTSRLVEELLDEDDV